MVDFRDLEDLNKDKQEHLATEVRFGQPFELPDLGRRPKGLELAAFTHYIMIHIAALLPQKYWGYYRDSLALQALLESRDPWPYCVEAEVPNGSL